MMYPRNFLGMTGYPRIRVIPVVAGTPEIIPADLDRYAIGFWLTNADVRITPQFNGAELLDYTLLADPILERIYTHALHGSIVNAAWRLTSPAGAANVIVLEGFLIPPGARRQRIGPQVTNPDPPA